jgi:hypothetical protein
MNDQTTQPTNEPSADPGKLPADLDSLSYEQLEVLAHEALFVPEDGVTPPSGDGVW